jgi:hypothetical protein
MRQIVLPVFFRKLPDHGIKTVDERPAPGFPRDVIEDPGKSDELVGGTRLTQEHDGIRDILRDKRTHSFIVVGQTSRPLAMDLFTFGEQFAKSDVIEHHFTPGFTSNKTRQNGWNPECDTLHIPRETFGPHGRAPE